MNERHINNNNYESQCTDMEWAVKLNRKSLQVLGIWPEHEKHDKISRAKNYLTIPFMIFWIIIFLFIPQMWAIKLNKDFVLILDNVLASSPTLTCSLKLFFLWQNSDVLRPVVNTISEDWLYTKPEWEFKIMRKEAKIAKFITIYGYTFVGSAYASWVLGSLTGLSPRLLSNITDYGDRHLFLQAYYPYNYSKSPNFELTNLSQIVAGCFLMLGLAIPDSYYGILIYHLSAQFKILGISIEHFIRNNTKSSKDLKKEVAAFTDRHVHLMRMVSAVEKSFNLLVLSQLFCMYVTVCCLAFRILYSINNSNDKILFFQILNLGSSLMIISLLMLTECFASETLISHSDALLNHIYSCKWYVLPKQNIHDLIIMMIMSKSPQILTAGKIMPLSFSNYCNIVKSIAGYLSVLITISMY